MILHRSLSRSRLLTTLPKIEAFTDLTSIAVVESVFLSTVLATVPGISWMGPLLFPSE